MTKPLRPLAVLWDVVLPLIAAGARLNCPDAAIFKYPITAKKLGSV